MTLFAFPPKSCHFSVPRKLIRIFCPNLGFQGRKIRKNNGENIFDLSLTVLWQFAIKILKGGNSVYREIKKKTRKINNELTKNAKR